MLSRRSRRRERADGGDEVNMSPLIDMTFLLLIFFAVTSTFVRDLEIPIERPGAASAAAIAADPLRVQIDRDGGLHVDSEPVRPWLLEEHVRERLERARNRDVLIVVDKASDAGRLISVVDRCRLAGATHVGVAVAEGDR